MGERPLSRTDDIYDIITSERYDERFGELERQQARGSRSISALRSRTWLIILRKEIRQSQ